MQKSSMVSRRVLLASHFSPDMRHRIGQSTKMVIWKLVNIGRTAGIVSRI